MSDTFPETYEKSFGACFSANRRSALKHVPMVATMQDAWRGSKPDKRASYSKISFFGRASEFLAYTKALAAVH